MGEHDLDSPIRLEQRHDIPKPGPRGHRVHDNQHCPLVPQCLTPLGVKAERPVHPLPVRHNPSAMLAPSASAEATARACAKGMNDNVAASETETSHRRSAGCVAEAASYLPERQQAAAPRPS